MTEANETIHVTSCPTCGALAQAITEGDGIKYRHCKTGGNPHAVYDFVDALYEKKFGKSDPALSIPQMCEKLLEGA